MNDPLVSVVIATHNREKLLPRAVQSILNQTHQNFEIIIVDDVSQDETPNVIDLLTKSDPRIKAFRSVNNIGPGAARNMGISHAQGEYIAIMDDDDISFPQRLEVQVSVLQKEPEIGLVSSIVEFIDKDLNTVSFSVVEPNGKPFPENPSDVFIRLYLEGCFIINPTIMARSKVWNKFRYPIEPWDAEDRYLFMQMAAKGVKMKLITQPLVRMLQDPRHESLTRIAYQKRIPAKRLILKMVRDWLKAEGIQEFDKYHHKAMSNQYLRESLHYKRDIQAILLIARAFLESPKNLEVKERLKSYLTALISEY